MDIGELISDTTSDLTSAERIIILATVLDEILKETEIMRKDICRIHEIPISLIDSFPDHPFKVENDEAIKDLVQSIKKNGMLIPGTVRRKNNGRYEMLSGHRRMLACKTVGIDTFRCLVLDLTDKEAALFVTEANLQRTKLTPSEKGRAYRMRQKFLAEGAEAKEIRIDPEDDPYKVNAFMQLANLTSELQEMVDKGKVSLRPAYALSYLPKSLQVDLIDAIELEQCAPTHGQANRMRLLYKEGVLTSDMIYEIMREEKANQKEKVVITDQAAISLMPVDLPVSQRGEYIAKALEFYRENGGKHGKETN